jgi:hypothetical protein
VAPVDQASIVLEKIVLERPVEKTDFAKHRPNSHCILFLTFILNGLLCLKSQKHVGILREGWALGLRSEMYLCSGTAKAVGQPDARLRSDTPHRLHLPQQAQPAICVPLRIVLNHGFRRLTISSSAKGRFS